MHATSPLEVGQMAPPFTLKAPGGQPVSLAEYRGKKHVVLVFFPASFSSVCAVQLPQMNAVRGKIEALGAVLFGVSVDNHFANEAFAKSLAIGFTLLSDFHRTMTADYGVLNEERGEAIRSAMIVARDGRLAYRDVSASPGEVSGIPGVDRLMAALEALG